MIDKGIVYTIGGLLAALVAFGGPYLWYSAFKVSKEIQRKKFESTNENGVIEYDSYDDLLKSKRREGLNAAKMPIGCVMFVIGGLSLLGAIEGFNTRGDADKKAEARDYSRYKMCVKAWDEGTADLEHCRDWCQFEPKNEADCIKFFGSKDGPKGYRRGNEDGGPEGLTAF